MPVCSQPKHPKPVILASDIKKVILSLAIAVIPGIGNALTCENPVIFQIPAQSLDSALLIFAQQARVAVLFPSGSYADIDANQVAGEYCVEQALELLLQGTGLQASISEDNLLVINENSFLDDDTESNADESGNSTPGFFSSLLSAIFSRAPDDFSPPQSARFNDHVLPEEITVTGTRIRQASGMTTPTPVTALSLEAVGAFDPGGTIAEQLDLLPQFFNTQTGQRGGSPLFGDAGGSYLDMRNLGTQRTLVLLDGFRVVPSDKRGSVNVDLFPTALMKSVEVVTGGASAAYGADALGGVTNFVLDREFRGLEFHIGSGVSEQRDGQRWNISLAGGLEIGSRLNLIGSIQAQKIDEIWRDPSNLDEDWFQRWGHVTNPEWYPGAGSGVPRLLTLPWVASSEATPAGMIWARKRSSSGSPLIPFALNGYTFTDDGDAVRPFNRGNVYVAPNALGSSSSVSGGTEAYISHIANDGGPQANEVITRSIFAAAKYDFNENLAGFAQLMVGRAESNDTYERGGWDYQNRLHLTVFRENPFLPGAVINAMDDAGISSFQLHKVGGFLGELNNRTGKQARGVFVTQSWNFGVEAKLGDLWNFRASWQKGEAHKRGSDTGARRVDRLFLAADAVKDPDTGAIVCNVQLVNPTNQELAESVTGLESSRGGPLLSPIGLDNSIRDCIPINIMGNGKITPEALDYILTPKFSDSLVKQDFVEILLTGDLLDLRRAGPVSLAAGLTYRTQSIAEAGLPFEIDILGPAINVPELGIRGISAGFENGSPNLHYASTIPNLNGQYHVNEWFAELNLPIWSGTGGIPLLSGSAAFRQSTYSTSGTVDSWKLGLDFQLLDDLRLRATRSRDVREANFTERFDAQGGFGQVRDPKFNGAFTQLTRTIGGNPDLRPELADTLVAGFVYQPNWLNGLQFSADWYDIEIRDAIGFLGIQRIVDECELRNVTSLCDQIERAQDGTIQRILDIYQNVDRAKVQGIDTEVIFLIEPDFFRDKFESMTLRILGGYVLKRSDTPLGGQSREFQGEIGSPELTALATLSYNVGSLNVQLQQRYISDTVLDIDWVEGIDVDTNRIASGNTTNLRMKYDVDIAGRGNWNLTFNITNLFDRHPPIVPNTGLRGGSQIVPEGYDVFGRRYHLNFSLNF